jgi:hypothetical protein
MATRVQDHPNYGMGVHTVQREMAIPLRSRVRLFRATVQTLNKMRKEIGLRRLVSMLRNVQRHVDEALQEYDFSPVRARGLSEMDLRVILDRMLTGVEMAREMGLEKAKEIRMAGSRAIADDYFGSVFPTQEYLERCEGGFFSNFKAFIAAFIAASGEKGIQGGCIIEPSPDMFIQRMEFCAMAEVAEILGDRDLCWWNGCVADDYFFPGYMAKAGGRYWRDGTIATGAPACDFCYECTNVGRPWTHPSNEVFEG